MAETPYRPFRPRRGRAVALTAAVLSVVIFTTVAFLVPRPESGFGGWTIADRVMVVGFGLLAAALMARYAAIRAVPDKEGISVRNLFRSYRVSWAEVLRVQFSGGAPWATLELASTDSVAVMAIQKADGQYARQQAARLVALAQFHGEAAEDPGV